MGFSQSPALGPGQVYVCDHILSIVRWPLGLDDSSKALDSLGALPWGMRQRDFDRLPMAAQDLRSSATRRGVSRVSRDFQLMSDEPLLTAAEVAARFRVDRGWVYAHARELGVVKIGAGPRPRLRFDPAVVDQRQLPAGGPTSVPTGGLLPVRPSRRYKRRRRVGGEEPRFTR